MKKPVETKLCVFKSRKSYCDFMKDILKYARQFFKSNRGSKHFLCEPFTTTNILPMALDNHLGVQREMKSVNGKCNLIVTVGENYDPIKTCCFAISAGDTIIPFSYKNIIEYPSHSVRVKRVLRLLAEKECEKYRNEYVKKNANPRRFNSVKSEFSGENISIQNIHVHHHGKTFSQLANKFIGFLEKHCERKKVDFAELIKLKSVNNMTCEFESARLNNKWIDFHSKYSNLMIVSKQEHKQIHSNLKGEK